MADKRLFEAPLNVEKFVVRRPLHCSVQRGSEDQLWRIR